MIAMHPERYLTAGELSGALAELGIRPCGYHACLEIIREARYEDGRPIAVGRQIRLSETIEWLRTHLVQPRSKHAHKRKGMRRDAQNASIKFL